MATDNRDGDIERRIDGSPIFDNIIQFVSAVDGVGSNLSGKTILDYSRKTASLENELNRLGVQVTPESMASLLEDKANSGKFAPATIRSLRSALLFWLHQQTQIALSSGIDLAPLQDALIKIKSVSTRASPKTTRLTSASKLKFFPESTLQKLVTHANEANGSRNIGALLSFIRANLLVGLRPSEWFGASLMTYLHRDVNGEYLRNKDGRIQSTPALLVRNAKASFGRANGYYRELLLTSISDADLASIIHFKDLINKFTVNYQDVKNEYELADAFFIPLQKSLAHALKKLNVASINTPTSYSTRHQAVANAKYSGMSDVEIAAFFGHSSTSTAKSHYGRKTSGWAKMTFRASIESVSAVPQKSVKQSMNPSPNTVLTASEWNANTQR